MVCILTRPTGSPKYGTTRKNTQRYYTTKLLIRYIYIIWNNKNLKVDCKTIYYPLYVEAAFLICKHMLLNMTNLESYNCAKRKGLKHSNFLVWTGIRQAIPPELKRLEVNENELWSLEFQRPAKIVSKKQRV